MRSFTSAPLADGGIVRVVGTERVDGDLGADAEPSGLAVRRRAIVDRPWVALRQVHGRDVLEVGDGAVESFDGSEADAVVTRRDDVALCVRSADCATLALWSTDGAIGAVHCGWRGLRDGVIEAAVARIGDPAGASVSAVLGPSIGPECYEFGPADLDDLRSRFGDVVVSATADGRPALDVRAGVRATLDRLGVRLVAADERCTACEADTLHSHRARGDRGRQALVVWIER